jgi:hypothetical protein
VLVVDNIVLFQSYFKTVVHDVFHLNMEIDKSPWVFGSSI